MVACVENENYKESNQLCLSVAFRVVHKIWHARAWCQRVMHIKCVAMNNHIEKEFYEKVCINDRRPTEAEPRACPRAPNTRVLVYARVVG